MNTKVKENGQAKVANTEAGKKAPQFVAGNPVNKVSENKEKADENPQTENKGFVDVNELVEQKPVAEQQIGAVGEKTQVHTAKTALNLEETLKLVADLSKKTALRSKYNYCIDRLRAFVIAQKDEDDMSKNDTNFKGCELIIRDGEGNTFQTESASVISGTVEFMTGRFMERLAEVEAEIILPA